MSVPYKIVVEPKEFENYANEIDESKIICAPENFSELGQGSIPVRNFVWQHAINQKVNRHWILDDNIGEFSRLNQNRRIRVDSGVLFKCAEDFTDRYENVALSGFNYRSFAPDRNERIAPFILNTRIYSCILIKNDIDFRWRGKYNEDTDLSIRVMKDGFCTILFNAFLIDKATTLTMRGGNTDTIYNTGDKRREFAESLKSQHPDIVDVVWRFNRWHHDVDYSVFKRNQLIKRSDIEINQGIDNYGMILKKVKEVEK
jgi:hypothetical protein